MTKRKLMSGGRWLLAAVVVVTLLTPLVTMTLLRGMSEKKVARVDVVIVAAKTEKMNDQAALYEALSRGQVVATAASVFGQPQWTADHPGVQLTAGSVAPSALIQIQAIGSDEQEVRTALMGAVGQATVQVNQMLAPYSAQPLSKGEPRMSSVGLTAPIRGLLVVIATLAAAYATFAIGNRFRSEGEG